MTIQVEQKEENGIFTVLIKAHLPELSGLRLGDKGELKTNQENKIPYTQVEKDILLSKTIERFYKRIFFENNYKIKKPE